jgi:hypothetical protein
MCHDRLVTFSLCLFLFFFWKCIFQIWESEHKLGAIAFPQRGPQLRETPYLISDLLNTIPTCEGW